MDKLERAPGSASTYKDEVEDIEAILDGATKAKTRPQGALLNRLEGAPPSTIQHHPAYR